MANKIIDKNMNLTFLKLIQLAKTLLSEFDYKYWLHH
jgi:hypothetical protein